MGRGFLASIGLKVHMRFITEDAMESLGILDNFDPFKDGSPG
jgi:hypothetical protein